jgi:hypothetical protein
MTAPQGPHNNDIVIHCTSTTYTVAVNPGPPQIKCRTLEEALERASAFASNGAVDIWWTSNGETYVRLSNYRLMRRIWAEFMEMPGLGLTKPQAQRLWGIDERTCAELLEGLVVLQFLRRGFDGRYRRVSEGRDSSTPARMAKVDRKSPVEEHAPLHGRRRPA